MKKVISLILAAVMALSLCTTAFAQKESVKIAIVQQLDHPSLDEIRTAAQARLAAIAQETGVAWLLAHAESSEAAQGAYVGLVGENIDIADSI